MRLLVPTTLLVLIGGCSSSEVCDATCDIDCDGVVDATCSVSQLFSAEAGGELKIDEGPLAGFSISIPPGALSEDTNISMEIRHNEDLQTEPWTFSDNVAEGDTMLHMDTWRALYEVLEDWGKYHPYDLFFVMEQLRHEGLGASAYTFHFEPSGLEFNQTVRLRLPYQEPTEEEPELWPALRIGQWSSVEPSARLLENTEVDPVAKTISGDMQHFSDYQIKTGIAKALKNLGGNIPNPTASLIKLASLALVNALDDSGETVVPADIKEHARNLANELFCGLEQADLSLPDDAKWNELMGILSTMPSLFGADHPDANTFATSHEDALAQAVRDHDAPVSFAKEFELSMKLNGGHVFNSLMTMHNLGQGGHNLQSHYEPMTNVHPGITDLRGAHYHMAGLAVLAMFNGNDAQSFAFGFGDEAVMSGILGSAFEPGELVANLIGSQLMTEIANWDESNCQAITGSMSACEAGNSLPDRELFIKSSCGRSWLITTDSNGAVGLPSIPADCTTVWLEKVIDGNTYQTAPITISPEAASTDLGELVLPTIPTAIEGFVFDEEIPPQPVVGATAVLNGQQGVADAAGVFSIDEQWLGCEPFTVSASLGTNEGTSFETTPVIGTTNVGVISLGIGEVIVDNMSGDETGEDGTTIWFDVSLRSDPGDQTIVIDVSSLDATEGIVEPAQLSFAPGEWETPKTVMVIGRYDNLFDGAIDYQVELAVSSPADYSRPAHVDLVNLDASCPYQTWTIGNGATQAAVGTRNDVCTREESLSANRRTIDISVSDGFSGSVPNLNGAVVPITVSYARELHSNDLAYWGYGPHDGTMTSTTDYSQTAELPTPTGRIPITLASSQVTDTESMVQELANVDRRSTSETLNTISYRQIPDPDNEGETLCEISLAYSVVEDTIFVEDSPFPETPTVYKDRVEKTRILTYVSGVQTDEQETIVEERQFAEDLYFGILYVWMASANPCGTNSGPQEYTSNIALRNSWL